MQTYNKENLEEQSLEEVNKEILILYIEKIKEENEKLKAKIEGLELRIETIQRERRYGKG